MLKSMNTKINKRRLIGLLFIICHLSFSVALTSCNDEWQDEQYEKYISFKAPLNDNGVTAVYVPYSRHNDDGSLMFGSEGKSSYDLPVIVAGTTRNGSDINVQVGHSDTLAILNYERFGSPTYRADITDLYYKDMSDYADYPGSVLVKSGEDVGLLRISFDFKGIDMVEKWVLPIEVKQAGGYQPHPRKNYAKAMLRVYPYNDYSGNYSATTLTVTNAADPNNATGMETARAYVVDENSVFFYMGNIDETRVDRRFYKVKFEFVPTTADKKQGTVRLSSDNAEKNNFVQHGIASYRIYEQADDVRPYLLHHYVIISGIEYDYTDYTSVENYPMNYTTKGILTLERQLNTQIPNEDQAIQW